MMLQSKLYCSLRTRISAAGLFTRRSLSSNKNKSSSTDSDRIISSVGGRKISVHEHHNVNEMDDQVPLIHTYKDEHSEAEDIQDDLHEKAIAIDAAQASEYGQVHVLPSSSAKHQKVRALTSE